jgi:hypothetical protein
MARSLTLPPKSFWSRMARAIRNPKVAARLALILTIAATLSGLATYVVLSGWLSFGGSIELVPALL